MGTLSPEEMKQLREHTKSLYPQLTETNLNNLNQEDMVALVDQATQTGVSPTDMSPAPVGSAGEAVAASALQSLTGDNLPSILAGMGSVYPREYLPSQLQKRLEAYLADKEYTPPKDMGYDELKKFYEERLKQVQETHPISSNVLGIPLGLVAGGELMSGLGIGGKAVSRFSSPAINQLATLAKQGAAQGAVTGAIQNTGRPEAFYESPEAALTKGLQIGGGAVVGGAISPAIGGLGMAVEKLGKSVFSVPFRKIDAQLHRENPSLGKKQFSDLLWKYQTGGNYADVQKAMELVAKEENYPVIQEMKRRVDEGTLGIEGKDLVDMLKKAISPKTGEGVEAGSVSNWIDKQIEAHYIAKGVPEEAAKVAANREAIRQAKLHNEAIAQQELPFMDLRQKTTTTAVPLTAPEKAMPPIEQIGLSMYPEQTQLQLKNLITGAEINPEIANRGTVGEAYKYMGMGIPEGPQKGLVMPVRAPYIVPEAERSIFGALQSEMENARILPMEKRNIGGVVLPKVAPVPGQLEMGFPTKKQMPMKVPMPIPQKGEKVAFSDLSDFVRKLQGEATWNPISAGATEKTKGGLFRNVATKGREIRNKMAEEVAPELYPEYQKVMKELGTIEAGRQPLTKLITAEEAAPFLPFKEEMIAAGLANLGGNLYNVINDDTTNFPEDRSYFYPVLTGLAATAAAINKPKSGQAIGKFLNKRGVNLQQVAPYLGAKAGQSALLQAIPYYLKPNEDQK